MIIITDTMTGATEIIETNTRYATGDAMVEAIEAKYLEQSGEPEELVMLAHGRHMNGTLWVTAQSSAYIMFAYQS